MRIRMQAKGDVYYDIQEMYNHLAMYDFFGVKERLTFLMNDIERHYLSRDMDITSITNKIHGFQYILNKGGNRELKKKICYDKIRDIVRMLEGSDRDKVKDKWEVLQEIIEDLQDDVARWLKTGKPADVEAIRYDFDRVKELEPEFKEDMILYKRYQDVARQIGVCNAALIKLMYGSIGPTERGKKIRDFDFIFPKLEFLLASKVRPAPEVQRVEQESLSEDQVNEIRFLSTEKGWSVEDICEHLGVDPSLVTQVIFGG